MIAVRDELPALPNGPVKQSSSMGRQSRRVNAYQRQTQQSSPTTGGAWLAGPDVRTWY